MSRERVVYTEEERKIQPTFDVRPWEIRFQWIIDLLNEPDIFPLTPIGPADRTSYLHGLNKSIKHKGGKPPVDYSVVELKVDLERLISGGLEEKEDWALAIRTYWRLLFLINPDVRGIETTR